MPTFECQPPSRMAPQIMSFLATNGSEESLRRLCQNHFLRDSSLRFAPFSLSLARVAEPPVPVALAQAGRAACTFGASTGGRTVQGMTCGALCYIRTSFLVTKGIYAHLSFIHLCVLPFMGWIGFKSVSRSGSKCSVPHP